MNNFDKTFAPVNSSSIPQPYIEAIQEYNRHPGYGRCCCALVMKEQDYNTFFGPNTTGEDVFALIEAPGGGNHCWYLCRYQSKLYFVFVAYNGLISARSTTKDEVDAHLEDGDHGGGLIGVDKIRRPLVINRPEPSSNSNWASMFDALQDDHFNTQSPPGLQEENFNWLTSGAAAATNPFSTPIRLDLPRTRLFEEDENTRLGGFDEPPPLRRLNAYSSACAFSEDPFKTPQRDPIVRLFPNLLNDDNESTELDDEPTEIDEEESVYENEGTEDVEQEDEEEDDEEQEDDESEYEDESEDEEESEYEDESEDMDSDDDSVIEAHDNVLVEPRARNQTQFYNPDQERGLPGSGPRGDYYDRQFDPDNRSKRRRL